MFNISIKGHSYCNWNWTDWKNIHNFWYEIQVWYESYTDGDLCLHMSFICKLTENSNWSYGLEMAKRSFDLCGWDLWPLTLVFCMGLTSVIGNKAWKFHDDTMRATQWNMCIRQTYRWTDECMDRLTEPFRELKMSVKSSVITVNLVIDFDKFDFMC